MITNIMQHVKLQWINSLYRYDQYMALLEQFRWLQPTPVWHKIRKNRTKLVLSSRAVRELKLSSSSRRFCPKQYKVELRSLIPSPTILGLRSIDIHPVGKPRGSHALC